MSPGAVAGRGLVHQAALYDGDEQLLNLVVPFVRDGLDTSEPTMVALSERHTKLVESVVAPGSGVSFLFDQYDRPANVLKTFDRRVRGYLSRGVPRIRIVGEIPPAELGASWSWWARYEATVNHAFAAFPLWGLCLFDRRVASAEVLADVAQTHPYLASADGHNMSNSRYTDPASFLSQRRSSRADPLETSPAVIELLNPAESTARRAVRDAAHATHLSVGEVEDLVAAVSETIANAIRHGRPPVWLRLWVARDRIVVTVTDQGSGPADPFLGLLPAAHAPAGGMGLWLTHQLCSLVTFDYRKDSFTIRLIAGSPQPGGETG